MSQAANETDVLAGLRTIVGNADAGKVFGPPIQQDGTILLPVARVGGAGGGGAGTGPADADQQVGGTGGGFGLSAKPLGVYVLRDGKARWLPAVDVNKIIMGAQLVAVAGMLVAAAVLRSRVKPQRRRRGTKMIVSR